MIIHLTFLLLFIHLCSGLSIPRSDGGLLPLGDGLLRRQATSTSASTSTSPPDSSCTNGPFTRQCWGGGYSIATDYDAVWPNTGRVVSYTLEITNTTMAPDGKPRLVMAVNGQFPGPTIIANWGDTLEITVRNRLENNGTSIHWHGIRQWKTSQMDGTNGVTECPLAPNQQKTYRFLCTQFGTTWYHSHFSSQYTDGVLGTILINGPTTSNYDVDLGTYPIQDWYYDTAPAIQYRFQFLGGRPPPGDNVLINGTQTSSFGGKYHRNTIQKGKRYKLRVINTSTDNHFRVSLDRHPFTVVTADFVPVVPYTTTWLSVAIGQRYDVIIYANRPPDSYWFHAVVQTDCGANKNGNALAIFSYTNATSQIPTFGQGNLPPTSGCVDETQLVPYVKLNVPSNQVIPQSSDLDVGFAVVQSNGQNVVQWNLNFTAINVTWEKPTLQNVIDGNSNYPKQLNLIDLPNVDTWSFWVIQATPNAPPVPHPMHLHGHDFYVLGTGSGVFNGDASPLKYTNPTRRDVATLPRHGWLVLAFITDNPGAWLMHCHIVSHLSLPSALMHSLCHLSLGRGVHSQVQHLKK